MRSFGLVLLFVFATAFAERRIKIGFVVGPESSRRESSDKFWSFARPSSSQLLLEPLEYRLPRWGGREIANAVCDSALRGARGLVVLCPPRLSSLAASYSSNLRLPLVTPQGGGGVMQFALLPDTFEAAAALLRDASSFAFLYDTDTGADQLSSILSLLQQGDEEGGAGVDQDPPWVEGFWRVYGVNDSLAFLRSLPPQTNRVLMAISSEKLADDILAGIGQSKPVHGIWLGTTTVSSANGRFPGGLSTLTKFQVSAVGGVPKQDLENRWRTLEDWRGGEKDMPESAVLSHDAIRVMYSVMEQLGTEWMDSSPMPPDTDCFNYTAGLPEGDALDMQAVSASGVTGSLKFNEDGLRTDFVLDIIETNSYGPRKVGTWSNSTGLQLNPDRRQTVRAERQRSDPPIRVTSIEVRPFLYKSESGGNYEGYVVDLIEELRRVTGRSFQLQLVTDGKYGIQVDGRWVGMIGELVDNVTDLVLAPLTKTPKRGMVVSFGKTFMTVGVTVILAKPNPQDHQTALGPLFPLAVWSPWQWAVVVLLLLVTSALGGAASRFVGVPDRVRALESKGKDGLSPCGSVWYSCGVLLFRDTGIYPRSLTHRALSASWWFLCILLAVFYVASLSAEVVRTRTTVTTTHSSKTSQQVLEDLLRKGSPIIGTIRSGSTPSFFRNSQVGLYREYGRFIDARPEVLTGNYSEGFRRVREGKGEYAFLAESISAEFEANRPPCDILLSSGYLATRLYAPATRLDNPTLRDIVDDGILRLTEDGVLRDLYEKWWHNFTDYCEDPNLDLLPKVYSSSMTLYETSGVFIVLLVGALVSAAAAFVENYVASKRITFLE